MRALSYRRQGGARDVLELTDLPTPEPGPGEVRVRLAFAALNAVDGYARQGLVGPMGFERIVPGQDGAGVVEAVGAEVADRRPGDRVWVYSGQWLRPFGTLAETITIEAGRTVPVPPGVPLEQAAAFGVVARTAHASLLWDGPVAGRTVLVSGGAGGTAQVAIRLARWLGATVLATVSSPEKAALATAAGTHHAIDYRRPEVAAEVLRLTEGRGVDRIVEVNLAANLALNAAILAPEGVIAAYGSPGGFTPELPLQPLMFRQASVRLVSSFHLPPRIEQEAQSGIAAAAQAGALTLPIALVRPLEQAVEAVEALERGELLGKALVAL